MAKQSQKESLWNSVRVNNREAEGAREREESGRKGSSVDCRTQKQKPNKPKPKRFVFNQIQL